MGTRRGTSISLSRLEITIFGESVLSTTLSTDFFYFLGVFSVFGFDTAIALGGALPAVCFLVFGGISLRLQT